MAQSLIRRTSLLPGFCILSATPQGPNTNFSSGPDQAYLVAAGLVYLFSQGAAALAQLARVLQLAQDELQRGELVQQQRQSLTARVQRLMQPDLL
jgi:hypothetical protein